MSEGGGGRENCLRWNGHGKQEGGWALPVPAGTRSRTAPLPHNPSPLPHTQPGGASHSPAPLSRLVGRPGHAAGTCEKFSQRAATRVSRCAAAPSVYDWQLRLQRTVISLQCGPRCSAECDPTPLGARPPDDGYSAEEDRWSGSAEEDRWSGRVSGRVRVRRRGHTGPRAPRGRSLVVLAVAALARRTPVSAHPAVVPSTQTTSTTVHRTGTRDARAARAATCAIPSVMPHSKIKCIPVHIHAPPTPRADTRP